MDAEPDIFGPEYWKSTEGPPAKVAAPEAASKAAREARVRRALRRRGQYLRKDRARKWAGMDIDHQGGYMIVSENNFIVAGARFDLSLEQVEAEAGL